MKWFIVITIIALSIQAIHGKTNEKKIPPKKAPTFVKPTKTPKSSVVDQFKELPKEDVDFIKELDKQFELHGDNIKIKIEKENVTTKNSKRTIDGELGYGYHGSEQLSAGYHFSPPKFMIYPYSQEDIPPATSSHYQSNGYNHEYNRHHNHLHYERPPPPPPHHPYHRTRNHHHQQHHYHHNSPSHQITSVTVEPSHGFELKEINSHGFRQYDIHQPQQNHHEQIAAYEQVPDPQLNHQHHQLHQTPYDTSPVIILRIPGPPKYAAHLQALLQQYLEFRAAQYIQALQQHEAANALTVTHHQDSVVPQINQNEHYVQHSEEHIVERPQLVYGVSSTVAPAVVIDNSQQIHQEFIDTQHYQIQPAQTIYQAHEQHESQSIAPPSQSSQLSVEPQQEVIYHYEQQPDQQHYQQQQEHIYQQNTQQQIDQSSGHHYVYDQSVTAQPAPITESTHLDVSPADAAAVYQQNDHNGQIYYANSVRPKGFGHHSNHHQSGYQQSGAVEQAVEVHPYQHDGTNEQLYTYQTYHNGQQITYEDQQQQHGYYPSLSKDYGVPSHSAVNTEQTITITQRPYNEHPYSYMSSTPAPKYLPSSTVSPGKSAKRQAPFTEEQYKKLNKLVKRLKKKSSVAREHANDSTIE